MCFHFIFCIYTVSVSFIFVYFLRCLRNLNFKIEIRVQQHRGFEGAERDEKQLKLFISTFMLPYFVLLQLTENIQMYNTLLLYSRPGNWCIVLRSDSYMYLNLFFRSNFTVIFTTKTFWKNRGKGVSNGLILLSNFCVCIKQMSDPGFLPAMHCELVLHFPHI